MKALILTIALPLAAWAQCSTTAECDTAIFENSKKLWQLQADSTATAVQATLTDDDAHNAIEAAGVTVVNAPHENGMYDPVWIGIDITTDGTITAPEKALAVKLIKDNHDGMESPGADVRIRYDRFADVAELLKAFTE